MTLPSLEISSKRPSSFVCPLSRQILDDPVMDLCAHNFERAFIEVWLEKHDYCPISHKPLSVNDLIPNHTLAERIERWRFMQATDGMVWDDEGKKDSATLSLSDDEAEGMERGIVKLPRRKRVRNEAHFILLPQEQHALELARRRDDEVLMQQRQRICRRACAAGMMATILALIIFGLYKIFHDGTVASWKDRLYHNS